MVKSHKIIRELDEYSRRANIQTSTICRNATGNPRLRERLLTRIELVDSDIERLRDWMKNNPVPTGTLGNQPVDGPVAVQGVAAKNLTSGDAA
jgi:hypothetical protein